MDSKSNLFIFISVEESINFLPPTRKSLQVIAEGDFLELVHMNKTVASLKSESWKMFNEISVRYDLLNRILSLGMDRYWRKGMAKFLLPKENQYVLDLATGTADVLLLMFESTLKVSKAVGIDLAERMLDQGRLKISKRGLISKINLAHGDMNQIPFAANTFDCVTIAFGIRNVADPKKVLAEMFGVLRPAGRGLILEFSLASPRPIRFFQLLYLRNIVPAMGFLLSGHFWAYRYLNQTIETFPHGNDFCQMMEGAGFTNVLAHPLCFGAATIYQGDKG